MKLFFLLTQTSKIFERLKSNKTNLHSKRGERVLLYINNISKQLPLCSMVYFLSLLLLECFIMFNIHLKLPHVDFLVACSISIVCFSKVATF